MYAIFLLFILLFNSAYPLHLNTNHVSSIENGWIEIMQANSTLYINNTTYRDNSIRFVAKCNEGFFLNSNSSEVIPIKLNNQDNWIPLNDYLIKGHTLLCSKECTFQSSLINGFIQIEATKPKATLKNNMFIQAYENSQIKFRCFEGYNIRSLSYKTGKIVNGNRGNNLNEKCESKGIEPLFKETVKRKSFKIKNETNSDQKTDNEKQFYQCFKYCSLFQLNFTAMNGFLVPARDLYEPGNQLQLLCNEGFLVEIPMYTNTEIKKSKEVRLSNMHTLECSLNGTWYLITPNTKIIKDSNTNDLQNRFYEIGFTNEQLKKIAKCSPIGSFLDSEHKNLLKSDIWSSNGTLSYNDLNMRTFSMMFAIGGFIMILILISLVTMRFVQNKRQHLAGFRDIFSDPLLFSNENPNFTSNTNDLYSSSAIASVQRSQIQTDQTVGGSLAFGSIGSSSDLNRLNSNQNQNLLNAYLPSYEEALLQQPMNQNINSNLLQTTRIIQSHANNETNNLLNLAANQPRTSAATLISPSHVEPPSNKNELVINETTSIIEIAPSTLQSLGITNHNTNSRSRSGSIRSNLTVRSANASIRTTNSIGTNSNASYNLPPPLNHHRKNNIRARRLHNFKNLSNHNRSSTRGISNQTVYTQNSNFSGASETNTILTGTTTAEESSILSNESNASVVALMGSVNDNDSNAGSI